jgi:arylsulfatase
MGYQQWFLDRMFMIAPAAAIVGRELQTLQEFPPRQRPGTFSLDNVMESIMSGIQP